MLSVRARRDALDAAIARRPRSEPWAGVVGRLSCLRGVSTLTAFGLATEIGDWQRFDGRSIGAYLGLVPSESSSGERRRQGAITKTGNGHARRLLVEAAWHQRRPAARPSRELARRREGQPALVRERAEAAERRLHRRWQQLRRARQALHGGRRGRGPRARRLVLEPRGHGRLKAPRPGRRGERAGPHRARSMRDAAMSSPNGPRSTLDERRSRRRDGHADSQTRAYQTDRASPPRPARSPRRPSHGTAISPQE